MASCCSSSTQENNYPKRHICPANGNEYLAVSPATIKHHLNEPWAWKETNQGYYYCTDPKCDVVYFAEDDSTLTQADLHTSVGRKSTSPDATVCYCYHASQQDIINNPSIRDFVIQETQAKNCACDSKNPSGRCCLADFPKQKNV